MMQIQINQIMCLNKIKKIISKITINDTAQKRIVIIFIAQQCFFIIQKSNIFFDILYYFHRID